MDGNDAVIQSGLQAGQQVVVAGVHVLNAGQKVTVFQSKYAASAPAQTQADAPVVNAPAAAGAAAAAPKQ